MLQILTFALGIIFMLLGSCEWTSGNVLDFGRANMTGVCFWFSAQGLPLSPYAEKFHR